MTNKPTHGDGTRYNLRNARRARAAALTTTCIVVVVSAAMTYGYFHGVLLRSPEAADAERSFAVTPASEPAIEADVARAPTGEDTAAFVSLFPGTSPRSTPSHEIGPATELQRSTDRVLPTIPEQGVKMEHESADGVAAPRSRAEHTISRGAPIGSIATSHGEYSIHRDAGGRVFAERVLPESAPTSRVAANEGEIHDE